MSNERDLTDRRAENTTYVIGHKSPDTDSVVSAITYAALKRHLGVSSVAAVAGKLNNETSFVLDFFNTAVPEIMTDASGKNLILVDHSDAFQAVNGIEQAHITELLDHHEAGALADIASELSRIQRVGATATIICRSYSENGIVFDRPTAGLLLSAILSDTKGFSLETTTGEDRSACIQLAHIAGIDDTAAFYAGMREYAESYEGMTTEEIFFSDYKDYGMAGVSIGIGCVNAARGKADELCETMKAFMRESYERIGKKHIYLVIFDGYNDRTLLLFYGDGADTVVRKAFGPSADDILRFHPAVSRKLDIVPALKAAYSDL